MRPDIKRTTRIRGTTVEIDQRAKELRHNPTPAEALLWARLRGHQLNGYKFRRQHPLGQFIADFCRPACRLIVELDGPIHLRQIQRDQDRTQHFEKFGYRVIRFTNERVEHDLDNVLKEIAAACQH
jgi:very-short-patch-repair endonuclease